MGSRNFLILTAFFITLEVYRLPVLGYNITVYHIFLAGALFMGLLDIFLHEKLRINRGVKIALRTLLVFAGYSFLMFLRNADVMRRESSSLYLAELIGAIMALAVPLLINDWRDLRRITMAFVGSTVFVYLGSFWHLFVFLNRGEYVTGVPFWHIFSRSEHVQNYLEDVSWFAGFPRFRLPFSSAAQTGLLLSLAGTFLLAITLQSIARKKRMPWGLLVLNIVNLLCLLGTFSRSGWAVFVIAAIIAWGYLSRPVLINYIKIALMLVVGVGFLFGVGILLPIGKDFSSFVMLRLDPEATPMSDVAHLESRRLALEYWADRPITGLGVGGFWEKPGGGIHTHSTYLTLLVERGIVGLVLFLSFLYQIYQLLRRQIAIARKCKDKAILTYNIAFLSNLIGLLFGHLLYQMDGEFVWLYYGLVLGYANLSGAESGSHFIAAGLSRKARQDSF